MESCSCIFGNLQFQQLDGASARRTPSEGHVTARKQVWTGWRDMHAAGRTPREERICQAGTRKKTAGRKLDGEMKEMIAEENGWGGCRGENEEW